MIAEGLPTDHSRGFGAGLNPRALTTNQAGSRPAPFRGFGRAEPGRFAPRYETASLHNRANHAGQSPWQRVVTLQSSLEQQGLGCPPWPPAR